jgi:hypothetical protein
MELTLEEMEWAENQPVEGNMRDRNKLHASIIRTQIIHSKMREIKPKEG